MSSGEPVVMATAYRWSTGRPAMAVTCGDVEINIVGDALCTGEDSWLPLAELNKLLACLSYVQRNWPTGLFEEQP